MKYIYFIAWCYVYLVTTPCDEKHDTSHGNNCYNKKYDCDNKEYYADKNKALDKAIKLHGQKKTLNGYISIENIKFDSISIDSINLEEIVKECY